MPGRPSVTTEITTTENETEDEYSEDEYSEDEFFEDEYSYSASGKVVVAGGLAVLIGGFHF